MAHRSASAYADRRNAASFKRPGRGTESGSRDSQPTSASTGIHPGNVRRIHPDHVGGVLLSFPHVVPETRQDLFQGLEENAITREHRTSAKQYPEGRNMDGRPCRSIWLIVPRRRVSTRRVKF